MGKQLATLGNHVDGRDSLERDFGPEIADALRDRARAKRLGSELSVDEYLQMADYMTSEPGTLEEKQGERRALALDAWDEEDRRVFVESLDELIEAARVEDLGLGDLEYEEEDEGASTKNAAMARIDEEIEEMEEEVDEEGELIDPLQLAHGEWGEMIVRVDRVQKVQKGGTLVRYRALVVGGNTKGCAGFGVAKANSPQEATALASRQCRRNIFFVDRHKGSGLTRDLAGRHNSCKVILRAVDPHFGLHGHPLVSDILLYCGITDCTAKTHGNRNQYNVVRATFKALMIHESMEEIALKRGKRLMNLERAKRLQL